MVVARIGGDTRFLAVASLTYLAERPPLLVPDDLRRHRCIRHRLPSGKPYRWGFEKHGQEARIDVPGALALDHTGLIVEAAIEGSASPMCPSAPSAPVWTMAGW
jgi:DNA-binding transcriptional LysR family regulator